MAYRKILVPLVGTQRDAVVLRHGFALAKTFASHVAALFIRPDPAEVIPYLGDGISASVVQEVIDASRAAAKNAGAAALSTFEHAAKAAGFATGTGPAGNVKKQETPGSAAGAGATFYSREGVIDDVVAEEARLSDLVLFDCPAETQEVGLRAAIESAIINGRKPVLLVPRSVEAIAGAKVAIGWDGGAAAAHAISAAIPLLKRADAVEILTLSSGAINTVQLDRLRDYLALHGIQAIEHGINPGSQGTAVALMDAAQHASAGLLVMGGYEHSRLREMALGGVTRHILGHATMPVLLAH
jgi:nucleotide-binding universal stress UspA family protein